MDACQSIESCLKARLYALRQMYEPRRYPCQDCREGCARQLDVWTPEPDGVIEPSHFFVNVTINPNDFLEDWEQAKLPPRGRKPKMTCSKGHRYSTRRKDGRWRCRLCEKARVRKRDRSVKRVAA
jgi:hypothetical protein